MKWATINSNEWCYQFTEIEEDDNKSINAIIKAIIQKFPNFDDCTNRTIDYGGYSFKITHDKVNSRLNIIYSENIPQALYSNRYYYSNLNYYSNTISNTNTINFDWILREKERTYNLSLPLIEKEVDQFLSKIEFLELHNHKYMRRLYEITVDYLKHKLNPDHIKFLSNDKNSGLTSLILDNIGVINISYTSISGNYLRVSFEIFDMNTEISYLYPLFSIDIKNGYDLITRLSNNTLKQLFIKIYTIYESFKSECPC